MMKKADVIIVGAGASGLMCAMEAGKRGRRVLVLDHAHKPGRKILMSGGGRCNFTNRSVEVGHYRCSTPDFCKSALSRFTQWDFLALVKKHRIAFVQREHGRLFCKRGAGDILRMLLTECESAGVTMQLHTAVLRVSQLGQRAFEVQTDRGPVRCESLVIAPDTLEIGYTDFHRAEECISRGKEAAQLMLPAIRNQLKYLEKKVAANAE